MSPGDIFLKQVAFGMDLVAILAVNLRKTRHAKGLTQEELADRAGLSARHLGDIERAEHAASVRVLGQLATALRVDPCDLICRSRPPSVTPGRGSRGGVEAETVRRARR